MADDLEAIKESGTLSAAMPCEYPAFSFVDEKNEVIGFDVDNDLAKRLGVIAWGGIIPRLLARKYAAIGVTPGETHEK